MAKRSPEQQKADDAKWTSPGILLDPDGNVVFDGEAEATGGKPFKNLAEIKAHQAKLDEQLAAYRAQTAAEEAYRGKFGTVPDTTKLSLAQWPAATALLTEAVRDGVPFDDDADFLAALEDATA